MNRILFALSFALVLLVSSPAFAGPYLNTAAMLVREGFLSADLLRSNLGERDLARAVHRMAEARVDLATHMVVPKEVDKAHPHFLLVLNSLERAADAATRGEVSVFLRNLDAARSEARTFKAVLEQLRLPLPSLRQCTATTPEPPSNTAQATTPAPPAVAPTTQPSPLSLPPRRALRRTGHRLAIDPPGLAPRTKLST